MIKEQIEKIRNFECIKYEDLKKEKKRIIAITSIFDLPLTPKETFDVLYNLLNENSKNSISKSSEIGSVFVRHFNQKSLHYTLTRNEFCTELELATFIGENLFKLNFEILEHKYGISTIAYTESWRYSQPLEWKTHYQLLRKQKKQVKNKAIDLKQSFYQEARL